MDLKFNNNLFIFWISGIVWISNSLLSSLSAAPPPMNDSPIITIQEGLTVSPISISENTPKNFKFIFPADMSSAANQLSNYSLQGPASGNAQLQSISGSGNGVYTLNYIGELYSGDLALVLVQANLLDTLNQPYSGDNLIPYRVEAPSVSLNLVEEEDSSDTRTFEIEMSNRSSTHLTINFVFSSEVTLNQDLFFKQPLWSNQRLIRSNF